MAGSVNYIHPADSATLTDQKDLRRKAIGAGIQLAVEKAIADPGDVILWNAGEPPKTVDVRPFRNILDAGAVLDQWNTAALLVVGTAYSVLQAIGAVAVPANRVWVFAGIGIETVPPPVSRVDFRVGGALGNIRATFDLEILFVQERLYGLFSEPVIYGPLDNAAIQVVARVATGLLARVPFDAWVIETGGQTVA